MASSLTVKESRKHLQLATISTANLLDIITQNCLSLYSSILSYENRINCSIISLWRQDIFGTRRRTSWWETRWTQSRMNRRYLVNQTAIRSTRKQLDPADDGIELVTFITIHWLDVPERVTFKLCMTIYNSVCTEWDRYICRRCAGRARRRLVVVICVLL